MWAELRCVQIKYQTVESFGELDKGDDWAKCGGWRTIGGQGVRATLEE